MLTNNKKSYFIKSIAMIMAVLMVLAVALTGCGNKAAEEAATKAEQAQNTADEAKTAAQAVADALKDYLKMDNAALTALIQDELNKFETSLEMSTYVKSEEFKTLTDKVATMYVKTEVDAAIEAAVKGKVTGAQLDEVKNELTSKIAADIQTAVAGLAKTADLGAYLKSADFQAKFDAALNEAKKAFPYLTEANLTDIKNKVNNVYTKSEVDTKISGLETKINGTLAGYYTKAQVDALLAAQAADIKQLQETVLAILEAFGVKTEAAADESLADQLKKFSAEQITALIAEKMSLTDWNAATEMVIDTIAAVQGMMKKIYGADGEVDDPANGDTTLDDGIYTHEDKKTINEAVAKVDADIVVFDENGELTEYATVAKLLEYRILRVPTVKAMTELKANLQAALDVKTFEQKLEVLTDKLKALGCEHTLSNVKYQVVTIDDLDAFYAINTEIDELITSYRYDIRKDDNGAWIFHTAAATDGHAKNEACWENQFVGTDYATTFGALPVYQVMKGTKKNATDKYVIVTELKNTATYSATPADGYTYAKLNKYTINDTLGTTNGSAWAPYNTNEEGLDATAVALYKLPIVPTDFAWDSVANVEKTFNDGHGKLAIKVAADGKADADLAETYAAVYAQLEDCVVAINVANDTFKKFLDQKVATGTITVDKKVWVLSAYETEQKKTNANWAITDALYLEALAIEMCEPMEATTDTLFLLLEVQEDMEAALNRNTCPLNKGEGEHSDELTGRIDKYDLYYDMQDKAWHLLFEEYQKRAISLLDRIIMDYKSIVDGINNLTASGNVNTIDAATFEADTNWTALQLKNLVTTGFANAFLNSDATFKWTTQGLGMPERTGITIEKDFKDWAIVDYYGYAVDPITGERVDADNNGIAATGNKPENIITSDPLKAIKDNANTIVLLLQANTLKVKAELAALKSTDSKFDTEANRDVRTAFNSYLNTGIKNLEEVYNRFLFADYKADVINDLYYAAGVYTEFYSVTTESAAALIEALEHYITGYSVTAATAADGTANKLFGAKETLLNNATVVTALNAITVDKNAFDATAPENYWNVVDAATTKKANVADLADDYLEVMENASIKNNFKAYLKTATDNLQYGYLQYMSNALDAETVDLLEAARKDAMYGISIIEYQVNFNTDAKALLMYKTWYTQILQKIASKETMTAKHFEYLCDTTVAKAIEKILSSDTSKVWGTGIYNVVKPVVIVAAMSDYYMFGSAAEAFDAAANHNTQYKDATGKFVDLYTKK